ncbi:uncharacterized protein LOC142587258 isoform X2 [Dermacentor variabilis]
MRKNKPGKTSAPPKPLESAASPPGGTATGSEGTPHPGDYGHHGHGGSGLDIFVYAAPDAVSALGGSASDITRTVFESQQGGKKDTDNGNGDEEGGDKASGKEDRKADDKAAGKANGNGNSSRQSRKPK